ncbi:hypothetical protein EUZ85_22875 [Hahella sp. KA22]|nr:hypothetical protein ENC22_20295 [Hahella sp. KA22]QAY56787.1 hypothetical protein EUZ85_22875 [Hahella sp. KA22]
MHLIRCLASFTFFLAVSGLAHAIDIPFFSDKLKYEVVVEDNEKLKSLVEDELDRQRDENLTLKQYTNPVKIARYEKDIIQRLLRSQGYYAGAVEYRLKEDDKGVTYLLTPGPLYKVQKITFDVPDGFKMPRASTWPLREGRALVASNVLDTQDALKRYIQENACFYEVKLSYVAEVNHADHSATVVYRMEPSPSVNFGEITVSGLTSVEEEYLRSKLGYEPGQCFNRARVDQARLNLLKTNLIARIETNIAQPENGRVDTSFSLQERNHRTRKAGIGYSTDEGIGLSLGWEHRNILGAGEKIEVGGRVSQVRRTVEGELTLPNFFRDDQSAILNGDLTKKELDAYDSLSAQTSLTIKRQFTDILSGSIGAQLKYSEVTDEGVTDEFGLVSFPFTLKLDTTDNLLDPRKGFILTAGVQPYIDTLETSRRFVKTTFSASTYLTADSFYWEPTLALRAATGTISGQSTDDIPADERFYVGGGGSVRGYPYQSLSRITGDDPFGGSSFNEVSVETRFRFSESWGAVLFVDGGFAFDDANLQPGEELKWGTGIGLRYFTFFAPIRFDVGVPLSPRDEVDDNFQLYISIGQAF